MNDGYIKLHRKCMEHEFFLELPYDRWRAWEYLIMKARYKPTKVMLKGQLVHLEKGQLIIGIDKLGETWGWSRMKVRRYMDMLADLGMIKKSGTPNGTLITIENYTFYQDQVRPNDTPNDTSDDTPNDTHKNKEKESIKKVKNILCANELFEELWKLYPNKKGKGQVSDAKKNKLVEVGREEMIRAIERYKKELDNESEWRQPQYGSTFFNSGYVDYLDKNYTEGNGIEKGGNRKTTELSAEDYY